MDYIKKIVDSVKETVDRIIENKKNEEKESIVTETSDHQENELGQTADTLLKLINDTIKFQPSDQYEKQYLIKLYNELADCYIRMKMPQHALKKLLELEQLPGFSININCDYLFLKAKALCKLEQYQDAYACCLYLKALNDKPNKSLDTAILKIEEELQSSMSDEKKITKIKRDVRVPRISNFVTDLERSTILEPLSTLLEPIDFSENSVPTRARKKDAVTTIKEFSEQGHISSVNYTTLSIKPFSTKCSVKLGLKLFETMSIGSNRKESKHNAAADMIDLLKKSGVSICY